MFKPLNSMGLTATDISCCYGEIKENVIGKEEKCQFNRNADDSFPCVYMPFLAQIAGYFLAKDFTTLFEYNLIFLFINLKEK